MLHGEGYISSSVIVFTIVTNTRDKIRYLYLLCNFVDIMFFYEKNHILHKITHLKEKKNENLNRGGTPK